MKNKRILVTGGAGFIGSHIVEALRRDNEVLVLDDLSTANKASLDFVSRPGAKFIKGSVCDSKLLKELLKGVDYIFHEAAIPSVSRSLDDPVKTNEANVTGTVKLLTAAKDSSVRKVVYASSSSVYGDTPTLPKKEDMSPRPKSPYAISKLAAENYCVAFSELYSMPVVSLRYFNVYGSRQDPKSDYAAVIPRFLSSAKRGMPLTIYGDGKQTRDFTYVKDVAAANIAACGTSKADGQVLNIAYGRNFSINELAAKVIDLIKSKSKIVHTKPREGDVRDSLADTSKAKKLLDWQPRYSLDDGLGAIVDEY